MYIEINEVNIGILNEKCRFIKIKASAFVLNADSVDIECRFYDNVVSALNTQLEGNEVLKPRILTMTGTDLEGWGTDDTYAEDWCLNELGLTRKT